MSLTSEKHENQENEQVMFDSLPDELVVLIFSHLSPEDLANNVSGVCLRWQFLAKDPFLWANAALLYDELHSQIFQRTIQFAPCLAKVEISMFQHLSYETCQSILSGCSSVKYLSFYPSHSTALCLKLQILELYQFNLKGLNMYVDDSYALFETPQKLSKIISNMNQLKELTLRGCLSSHLFLEDLFCSNLQGLRSLDISGLDKSPEITSITWQHSILRIVKHTAHNLRMLSLPQGVFDYSLTSLIEDSFASPTIEYLKIDEVCLWAVKRLQSLKKLHIVGMSVKYLSHLRDVCLSSALPYNLLFDWVSNNAQFLNVKELTLENIFDDDRKIIFNLLNACKNLESLTLLSACFSHSQLAFIITQIPPLKTLNIHRMSCIKPRHLELIILHQPNLIHLNLMHNQLTDGILQYYEDKVHSRMPNLQLKCDWGYWTKSGGQPWRPKSNVHGFKTTPSLEHSGVHSDDLFPLVARILDTLSDQEDD